MRCTEQIRAELPPCTQPPATATPPHPPRRREPPHPSPPRQLQGGRVRENVSPALTCFGLVTPSREATSSCEQFKLREYYFSRHGTTNFPKETSHETKEKN